MSILLQKNLFSLSLWVSPLSKLLNSFHSNHFISQNSRGSFDKRRPIDCPNTPVTTCKTLTPRKCSPTDPPVRPCSEKDCAEPPSYSCCVSSELARHICREKESNSKNNPAPFQSMWKTHNLKTEVPPQYMQWNYPPECCPQCEEVRFDVIYYRPSNKFRDFQRTWWECSPRVLPKKVCCFWDAIPPEFEKRQRPICPRSLCTPEDQKNRLACINKKSGGCMRLAMPCCRVAARFPPDCTKERKKTDCSKPKCPFPSYSECDREDLAVLPERPAECRCLDDTFKCLAVKYMTERVKANSKFCPCPACPCIIPRVCSL